VSDGDPGSPSTDRVMTLDTSRHGAATVVTVSGELDLHTARDLMVAVDDAMTGAGVEAIVIDLSAVSFLGSSGLGTLAELATRAPASGRPDEHPVPVRLVSPQDNRAVVRPWEVMHLQPILPLYPDVPSALAG